MSSSGSRNLVLVVLYLAHDRPPKILRSVLLFELNVLQQTNVCRESPNVLQHVKVNNVFKAYKFSE
jgi:hypothetical protein